eukprot:3485377-Pleurochrysis_carterae.AAC.1
MPSSRCSNFVLEQGALGSEQSATLWPFVLSYARQNVFSEVWAHIPSCQTLDTDVLAEDAHIALSNYYVEGLLKHGSSKPASKRSSVSIGGRDCATESASDLRLKKGVVENV